MRAVALLAIAILAALAGLLVTRAHVGLPLLAQPAAAAPERRMRQPASLVMPHSATAQCRVLSFAQRDTPPCAEEERRHPFSGCLTDKYEAETIQALLAGRVRPLNTAAERRAGWGRADASTHRSSHHRPCASCLLPASPLTACAAASWMPPRSGGWRASTASLLAACECAGQEGTSGACTPLPAWRLSPAEITAAPPALLPAPCRPPSSHVVWTISFSYGQLRPTDHITAPQPGVCFAGFVDTAALQQLKGQPALNATHYGRWQLVVLDSAMLSSTIARSAHMLRMLAPRLFPAASASLYADIKLPLPADPLGVLRALEAAPAPIMLGTLRHPKKGQDTFGEVGR